MPGCSPTCTWGRPQTQPRVSGWETVLHPACDTLRLKICLLFICSSGLSVLYFYLLRPTRPPQGGTFTLPRVLTEGLPGAAGYPPLVARGLTPAHGAGGPVGVRPWVRVASGGAGEAASGRCGTPDRLPGVLGLLCSARVKITC